ncbi:exodeoxyribonuclease VII large subunit [Tundrisphaera sp. TA3]|uniref:exodeoxyribonuclease VII large subunit n=1 Tax=Tundrisphaera sp. TA3 TaxID=3435775 RepID=UPI003EBF7E3F
MASLFPLFDRPENRAESTVSELTERIKDALETDFADVTVVGEVSNQSRPRSGHVYLSLKDDSAQIRAVIWKSLAGKLAFDLSDGLSVRARGEVTVYAPRGEYQITIRSLEPEGIGALDLAFRQRYARLHAEGLFDPERKRPLPRFPRRIVVVSSPTGAAIRDFLQVAGRRWAATEILVAPTRVQGPGSAEEIAAAIALANRVEGVDFLVVARGGGSLEDLWAFNEEVVARAIAGSRVPVVSAVGHEVDVTLADHAADFRALTPSEAGERCLPDAREARAVLDQARALLVRDARDRLASHRIGLDALSERLDRALRRQVDDRRHQLARLAGKLESLSPVAVLARGYSLTFRDGDPAPIRDARSVSPGDLLLSRLALGTVASRVEEVRPGESAPVPTPETRPPAPGETDA